jgi:hypothetical protein
MAVIIHHLTANGFASVASCTSNAAMTLDWQKPTHGA